jgi:hypothetical protein
MKLYTEQQLKEAMKTIALYVYDKSESQGINTVFLIHNYINNLVPYHSVEANEMVTDEEILIAAKEYDRINTIWGSSKVFIDAVKWYQQQLNPKS